MRTHVLPLPPQIGQFLTIHEDRAIEKKRKQGNLKRLKDVNGQAHLATSTTSCILFCIASAQWRHKGVTLSGNSLLPFLTQSQSSSFSTHAKHVSEVEMNSGSLAAPRSRLFPQCVLMEPNAQSQGVTLDRSKHSLPKRRRFRNVLPQQKESGGKRSEGAF